MRNGALRVDLPGPADDIGFGIVVEVALGEGRGIERIEDLPELADAHLDRGVLDAVLLCRASDVINGDFLAPEPPLTRRRINTLSKSRARSDRALIGVK